MGWPNTWENMEPWRRRSVIATLAAAGTCFLLLPLGGRIRVVPSPLLWFLPDETAVSVGVAGALFGLPAFLFAAFMLYSTRRNP